MGRPPLEAGPRLAEKAVFTLALFFTAAGELMASSDCETGWEKSLLEGVGNEAGSGETAKPT